MLILDALAERRIQEAQAHGEFDGLPGTGTPLELGDDALVPEELRVAYRLLKNAGFLPPELEARGEIRRIEQLLAHASDDGERARLVARIRFLMERAAPMHRSLRIEQEYLERIADRLAQTRARRAA